MYETYACVIHTILLSYMCININCQSFHINVCAGVHVLCEALIFILLVIFKCNRTIGSRSIGHRVWCRCMSLNILTELSVN